MPSEEPGPHVGDRAEKASGLFPSFQAHLARQETISRQPVHRRARPGWNPVREPCSFRDVSSSLSLRQRVSCARAVEFPMGRKGLCRRFGDFVHDLAWNTSASRRWLGTWTYSSLRIADEVVPYRSCGRLSLPSASSLCWFGRWPLYFPSHHARRCHEPCDVRLDQLQQEHLPQSP